ncbi:undecaprenyl-phosphate galactose phosphotransferase WbaP [Escherichia albertii]|uniref:undecaprenyl-phosphate galactose phosphotransferase WbaP n=2 Tax=Escherichia albertii TaxID=208962 RepID=UPI00211A6405|nr:undecaprenyl-phosphate galactose phosphotransferase WbaP [Escherichia albertii]WCC57287.1 undecaprenyl-phosphate galactose phosphotransferase WbaP [Escherichia albertii]WGU11300.1 undecaprenyl-phosphate galactose phosphotransferase WbaP [Escherichia albertii]
MNGNLMLIIEKITSAISDFIILLISFWVSIYLVEYLFNNLPAFIPQNEFDDKIIAHIVLSIICVGWFWIRLRHYSYRKPFWFELKEILRTLVIFAVIELAINAFSKWHFSRYLWGFTWVLTFIFLPLGRSFVRRVLDKIGLWQRDTIIIGCGKNARDAYLAINSEKNLGFKVSCFIGKLEHEDKIYGRPVIDADINVIKRITNKSTQIIIAVESEQIEERNNWIKELSKYKFRHVSVIPTIRGLPLYGTDMAFIFSHEVMILRVNNNLAKWTSRFAKRVFDLLGALIIILVSSPLLAYLYFQVKKDGGPAFYGHERIGRNGKRFKCLKFRSMILNSQEVLAELLANNESARQEWEKDFKLKNDPRITKIGHFIRKSSLDELPQLFNVLKGEMSLVGPRPIVHDELIKYSDDVDYYLMAKPGMTGLWQVSGRNDINYETRVYFDAWYVKNWSLWNDIAILFKTISVVLRRDGAY